MAGVRRGRGRGVRARSAIVGVGGRGRIGGGNPPNPTIAFAPRALCRASRSNSLSPFPFERRPCRLAVHRLSRGMLLKVFWHSTQVMETISCSINKFDIFWKSVSLVDSWTEFVCRNNTGLVLLVPLFYSNISSFQMRSIYIWGSFWYFYLYLFIMKIWEKAGEIWECSQNPPPHPADLVLCASTDDLLFRCPLSARFEVLQSGMMSAKKSVSLVPLLCGHAKLFLLSPCSANIFSENVFQKVRLASFCGKERLTFFFKLENSFLFHYYSFKSSVFFSEVL